MLSNYQLLFQRSPSNELRHALATVQAERSGGAISGRTWRPQRRAHRVLDITERSPVQSALGDAYRSFGRRILRRGGGGGSKLAAAGCSPEVKTAFLREFSSVHLTHRWSIKVYLSKCPRLSNHYGAAQETAWHTAEGSLQRLGRLSGCERLFSTPTAPGSSVTQKVLASALPSSVTVRPKSRMRSG